MTEVKATWTVLLSSGAAARVTATSWEHSSDGKDYIFRDGQGIAAVFYRAAVVAVLEQNDATYLIPQVSA